MINHPDIEFRKNTDPFHTAFQLAFNTDIAYFGAGGWLTEHPQEAIKFGLRWLATILSLTLTKILLVTFKKKISMGAVGPASDPGVTTDFPWDAITKGKDGIVDVGGGQGTLCCSLAAK